MWDHYSVDPRNPSSRSCHGAPLTGRTTMADSALQFRDDDFDGALPPEGYYAAVIERSRFHTSRQGNTTLQVVCEIEGVDDRVADYFVLSGASERGRTVSRRRLIELYHACGFSPKTGDPIRPEASAAAGSRSSSVTKRTRA